MAQNNNKENKGMMKTLIILILVLLLLIGGVLCYFFVIRPNSRGIKGGQREADALKGSLSVMSDEEIQQALNDIVEEGMFRISIASNIIAIEDGKAQLRIENNIQNRYIMQVSIYLDENGEEIYSTNLIDPGYYIQEAELDKHLDPGEYQATAIFTALYPDTEEIVGQAGAQVTIHVYADAAAIPQK